MASEQPATNELSLDERFHAATGTITSQRLSAIVTWTQRPNFWKANMTLTRREFAASVVSAAATAPAMWLGGAVVAVADDPKMPAEPPVVDPVRLEAALWLESIRVRYPDSRLTPDVLQLVAGDVLGDVMHCRRISAFPLKNSDVPAFEFFA